MTATERPLYETCIMESRPERRPRRLGRAGLIAALATMGASSWACGTHDTSGAPTTSGSGPSPNAETGYVPVTLRAHPLARPEDDRGPLDPGKHLSNLSLVFRLTSEQLRERDALKAAQLDPGSSSYHKWLTPEQYAARFGASPADLERARSWLVSQGLDVHGSSRLGSRVTFSGTVGAIQRAFRADLHRYEVGGEMHYAMATPAQVPADLAGSVLAVTNTHDFNPRPMSRLVPEYSTGKITGFAPPDWANVYDVAKLYATGVKGTPVTGAGVTIAVVGAAQIAQSDIDAWRTQFGLPASTVTMTLVPDTGAAAPGTQGSGFEAVLDVEWSGGIGQGAIVDYVFIGADDTNVDDATYYAIENDLAPIISESWGSCEAYDLQSQMAPGDQNLIDTYGSAANLLGITYIAASGDSGAAACAGAPAGLYVNVPAAYPGVTAVGGTQFPAGSLTGTPYFTAYSTSETTWNEGMSATMGAAGGGGISSLFARPSYQSAVATCSMVGSLPLAGTVAADMRMVPDVAFTSASGVGTVSELAECTIDGATGDCGPVGGNPKIRGGGGTSYAAPAFAGVVSLVEQIVGEPLGNINPLLYAIAQSTPSPFHDITTGSNEILCKSTDPGCSASGVYGYPAAAGYDCATGLGSLDAYALLAAWGKLAPTSITLAPSPTSTTEGSPVSLAATVDVPMPNGQVLGGTVTYAFESYAADGSPDLSWTLGTANIVGGSVSSGTTSLSTAIPPGLVRPGMQYVDVVAEYGGDAYHLASASPKVRIDFSPIAFSIAPMMATVQPGATQQFTSTSGVAPVKWYTGTDTTCGAPMLCSSIGETTGLFTAGTGAPGSVQIVALDADGAEVTAQVTVPMAMVPDAGTTADAGTSVDSGTTPDSGTVADSGSHADSGATTDASSSADAAGDDASATDGSAFDASEAPHADGGSGAGGSGGGCGCAMVGRSVGGAEGPAASFAFGFALLALLTSSRRRSSERAPR